MAYLKRLKWLIIPIFAILLMSHNTSALDINQAVEFKQTWTNNRMVCAARFGSNISFNGNTCVLNGPGSTGLIGTGLSYIYTADVNLVQGDYYEFLLQVGVSGDAQTNIPIVWNMATTSNFTLVSFEKVSIDENLGSSATSEAYVSFYRVILRSSVNNSSYPLELGYSNHQTNMFYIAGDTGSLTVDFRISSINRYSPKTDDQQSVVDAINDQTEKEEQASNNISNQSADDYEMESASMSSLFSQFGGFISAVNGASIGDCNIPADFNHIDLGILDLCRNPVPDYVQVAVSIVLCMLIAPYLMNIIKRILSIADKIREV